MSIKVLKNNGKRYSSELKFELVLKSILNIDTLENLSKENNVSIKSITEWKREFVENGHKIFEEKSNKKEKLDEKDKTIKKQQTEVALLKKLLEHYKKTRKEQSSA